MSATTTDLQVLAESMYAHTLCGICEQSDGGQSDTVWWSNPISLIAHSVCRVDTRGPEADLWEVINNCFPDENSSQDQLGRKNAHIAAIKAVRSKLQGVSIKTFLETNGEKALKALFNSVGRRAALTYAYSSPEVSKMPSQVSPSFRVSPY